MVNYQLYGQLVIEAKVEVNEVAAKIPDGELNGELISAIDADEAWGATISEEYPDKYSS